MERTAPLTEEEEQEMHRLLDSLAEAEELDLRDDQGSQTDSSSGRGAP